jgi:hypothetical protein
MLTLPPRIPTVTALRPLIPTVAPALHTTPLSDLHPVCSHPVRPCPDLPVTSALPRPDPCKVTSADPVPATFLCRTPLPDPDPQEKPAVILDTPLPTVKDMRTLPVHPAPARTTMVVSDLHADTSHPDPATREDSVVLDSPIPAPSTLTTQDPVAAALPRSPLLTMASSADTAPVTEPLLDPTLSSARLLPVTADGPRHSALVSDAHVVASHAVLPDRPPAVCDPLPMLAPCTVTRPDPVDPPLPLVSELSCPLPADTAADRLPATAPDDIDTRRDPPDTGPIPQIKAVSDIHVLRSHLDPANRAPPVPSNLPSPVPCTDTTAEPVAAQFPGLTTHIATPS